MTEQDWVDSKVLLLSKGRNVLWNDLHNIIMIYWLQLSPHTSVNLTQDHHHYYTGLQPY